MLLSRLKLGSAILLILLGGGRSRSRGNTASSFVPTHRECHAVASILQAAGSGFVATRTSSSAILDMS